MRCVERVFALSSQNERRANQGKKFKSLNIKMIALIFTNTRVNALNNTEKSESIEFDCIMEMKSASKRCDYNWQSHRPQRNEPTQRVSQSTNRFDQSFKNNSICILSELRSDIREALGYLKSARHSISIETDERKHSTRAYVIG